MARTVHVVPFVGSKERLWNQIFYYMSTQGFQYERVKGEWVFQKGDGWLIAPSFFKVEFTPTQAIVQAWIKTALLPKVFVGESGLDSMYGIAAKGAIKKAVAVLEPLIQTGTTTEGTPLDPPPAPVMPPMCVNPAYQQPPYQQPPYQQPPYQQPAAAQPAFCRHCGTAANGGAFCSVCGRRYGE